MKKFLSTLFMLLFVALPSHAYEVSTIDAGVYMALGYVGQAEDMILGYRQDSSEDKSYGKALQEMIYKMNPALKSGTREQKLEILSKVSDLVKLGAMGVYEDHGRDFPNALQLVIAKCNTLGIDSSHFRNILREVEERSSRR